MTLPEVSLPLQTASQLAEAGSAFDDLDSLEQAIERDADFHRSLQEILGDFSETAAALWEAHDHLVVRGVPSSDTGSNLLLLGAALFAELKTYRAGQIVKHFRMSPWTKALSHTLADGHFHTDINTAQVPPSATLIQCIHPDPDAPRHGQLRVARLSDVLRVVQTMKHSRLQQFLMEDVVTMVNDTSPDQWTGRITNGETIRFHPETLRAGQRRCHSNAPDLEECLGVLHEVATQVSEPIDLARGDVLIVSNRRALHQRSACTVRFRSSRRDFDSRFVAVLHAMDEPT